METIKTIIKCDRFLGLLISALEVGYFDPKTKQYIKTDVGTLQGSVLSPLLANIVLHKFDKYLTEQVLPKYNRGSRRITNPEYNAVAVIRDPKKHPNATSKERDEALKLMQKLPRFVPKDHNYRRSMYVRYADDFVFLLEGTKAEALSIKEEIKTFLRDSIGLQLNEEKTLVTHISEGFEFLGALIKGPKRVGYMMKTTTSSGKRITMRANIRAGVYMPTKKLIEKLVKANFAHRNHKNVLLAKPKTELVNLDHATIIQFYNSKVYGLINYYSFAANRIETQNLI